MRASSRLFVVGLVASALVLTGCADDDIDLLDDGVSAGVEDGDDLDLGDADLLEEGDLEDIDRGVLLLDESMEPDEVLYAAEAEDQCLSDAGEEAPDTQPQMRVDLEGEGSLIVTYDAELEELYDVDLVTQPDAPAVTWDAAGAGAWEHRGGALIGEVTVDGGDDDSAAERTLRFVIDWDDEVEECLDVDEPVTELSGEASYLELPGARIDAVEVCEEPDGDGGRTWTMLLEDGSVLTVTGSDADDVLVELTLGGDDVQDLVVDSHTGVTADDGDLEGTLSFTDPGSGEPVTASFRVDREAALGCEAG